MNAKDAEFIAGFDWGRIMVVNNFFDNIEDHEDDWQQMEPETEEEEKIISFMEKNPEAAGAFYKACIEGIKEAILQCIEMERDELITSMIDSMDEDEYESNKESADKGEYKNCLETYEFEKDDQENWED